jgi:hypothetical protein
MIKTTVFQQIYSLSFEPLVDSLNDAWVLAKLRDGQRCSL